MSVFLYDLVLKLFHFAIRCKALTNRKAKLWIAGRKGLFVFLRNTIQPGKPLIWMHAASLGEYEQGRPVLERLQLEFPGHQFLLTFFSPSGYEVVKERDTGCTVSYLPLDSRKNARKFMETVNPAIAIFVKYEFWYHYIRSLARKDIPFYFVSAKFRPGQWIFKASGNFMRNALRNASGIFVQDNESKELLERHAFSNVTVTGDTRIDRVIVTAEEPYMSIFDISGHEKPVRLIAGSTWPGDEHVILPWINEHMEPVIIAPHEIAEKRLQDIEASMTKQVKRLSGLQPGMEIPAITLVDSIGQLKYLYRYADIAYIGGGFNTGIHNILEAAVFGIPVIFGPRYEKFAEAMALLETGAAFSVRDADAFADVMKKLQSPIKRQEIAGILQAYFDCHCGATEQVVEAIKVPYKSEQ